jgi:hypothetical protein
MTLRGFLTPARWVIAGFAIATPWIHPCATVGVCFDLTVFLLPVRHPLPDVANHVVQSTAIGWE